MGCGWCTRASSGFLADVLVPARKALAVYPFPSPSPNFITALRYLINPLFRYPVCLFYALIARMVLVRTG